MEKNSSAPPMQNQTILQKADTNKQISSPSITSNHIVVENLQINLSSQGDNNNNNNLNDQAICAANMIVNIDDSSCKKSISNKINPPQDNDIDQGINKNNDHKLSNNSQFKEKKFISPVCIIEPEETGNKKKNNRCKEVTINNKNINFRPINKQIKGITSTTVTSMYGGNIIEASGDTLMFFFINKYAGEGKGKYLLDMGVKKLEFASDLKVTAYIFDFNGSSNSNNNSNNNDDKQQGIEALKAELSRRTSFIKVIIGGGDGSILSFIERLNDNDIDLNRLIFGIIPLGRTNDISRQFRWGESAEITCDMAAFKLLVQKINQSPSVIVDLWEIKLSCDEHNGAIITYSSNTQKKLPQKDNNNKKQTIFRKGFIGYCSFGYDARIGFDARKTRSECKCWNNALVFWEKCKKCFYRKSLPINCFIDSFYVINMHKEGASTNNMSSFSDMTYKENENRKTKIFQTLDKDGVLPSKVKDNNANNNNDDDSDDDDNEGRSNNAFSTFRMKEIVLKGQPLGFVCQNIEYFSNGNQSSWKKIKKEYGLETYDPKIVKEDKEAMEKKEANDIKMFESVFQNSTQSFSDRKLEFYTYDSIIDIGSGKKEKIYHGEGPFMIKFKQTPLLKEEDKYNRIYMNVDGEYYNIVKPLEMRIRLAKRINNGKVRFLQNI